jgi:hypothetical protein
VKHSNSTAHMSTSSSSGAINTYLSFRMCDY